MDMVITDPNDSNSLKAILASMADGKIPDFKRLYLLQRVVTEKDPAHYELFRGLLENYDLGLIDMTIDPWERCVKYIAREVN